MVEVMKTYDYSTMIVLYNLVIGILIMLSSQKLGELAGNLIRSDPVKLMRLTRVSTFTFGATVATLSAFIYVVFHLLKIGV